MLAYLDPGSGSLLVQAVLGGVAGLAVAFKLFRHRIARVFGRGRDERAMSPDTQPITPEEAI